MNTLHKYLTISGVGALVAVGAVLTTKAARNRHRAGMYEKMGKSIDERLMASKGAYDKATAHVRNIVEQIKNRKI